MKFPTTNSVSLILIGAFFIGQQTFAETIRIPGVNEIQSRKASFAAEAKQQGVPVEQVAYERLAKEQKALKERIAASMTLPVPNSEIAQIINKNISTRLQTNQHTPADFDNSCKIIGAQVDPSGKLKLSVIIPIRIYDEVTRDLKNSKARTPIVYEFAPNSFFAEGLYLKDVFFKGVSSDGEPTLVFAANPTTHKLTIFEPVRWLPVSGVKNVWPTRCSTPSEVHRISNPGPRQYSSVEALSQNYMEFTPPQTIPSYHDYKSYYDVWHKFDVVYDSSLENILSGLKLE